MKELVDNIKSSIDIIVSIKLEEELQKYLPEKDNPNSATKYETLLQKEEEALRQHISVEHQLKIQCEKFREEYQKKYDEISNDVIIKENEDLRNRIKECQENTNKIKENINEQMEMRKKQNDSITSMLNGQINDKLSEIDKETNKFEAENEHGVTGWGREPV